MKKEGELKRLALRIRELRTKKGLTQAGLADLAGKDKQSIQRLERGKYNPTYFYLIEICKALEVDFSELNFTPTD